jgi:hypothetical protein
VVVFALPYVGRAAIYSAVGHVERQAAAQAETRKAQIEARLAVRPDNPELREELDRIGQLLTRLERKPVWMVLLNWDKGRVWPTALAGLLILYNIGLYVLITRVSTLRDEEERSGWSPAWREYGQLVWVHRVVVILFYVAVVSFLLNMAEVLREEILIPKLH